MSRLPAASPLAAAPAGNPFFTHLECRECGREYGRDSAIHVCEHDFGPLEAGYDEAARRLVVTREAIAARPGNLWRYREFLPIVHPPTTGRATGGTPLLRADRLARRLGIRELWIKNDAVNHPTLSFKDRVTAVALARAKELGFRTVACASTGNLANAVAAGAAAIGLECFVFVPHDLERAKIAASLVHGARVVGVRGPYDRVNRLCSEIAGRHGWGFVNVNLRPYYAEGSKTVGFEIAEQLGWQIPRHVVVPVASGALLTKIHRAFREWTEAGLVDAAPASFHAAQAAGCSPVSDAILSGSDVVRPVARPQTVVKSLAIGTPADGHYALEVVRKSGGSAAAVSDDEVRAGIRLLAETEGIFAETAGGTTVASARRLIESGAIPRDESAVLVITGNGLKTLDAFGEGSLPEPEVIDGSLRAFEEEVLGRGRGAQATV